MSDQYILYSLVATILLVIATFVSAIIVGWYARKDRKIKLYEDKLQKIYFPLKHHTKYLKEVSKGGAVLEFHSREFLKFWDKIAIHSYLASPKLKPTLDAILKQIDKPSFDVKEREELNFLIFEVEKIIDNDLKEYSQKLDSLIG